MRQVAILAGGLGSRLGELTAHVPKPILPCGDRPFLAWLIRELVRFGIEEIVLLAGHLAPVLEAAMPSILAGLPRPVAVECVVEPFRAGTGGALFHALARLDERFLLLNGDSILDCNLARLLLRDPGPGSRIVLRALPDTDRYGVVTVDGDRVTGFLPRAPAAGGRGLVNAGIYLLERDALGALRPDCSFEADSLPALARSGRLRAAVADGFFVDIGVPEDLAHARAALPARLHRPALFLDRDGTINRDGGWVGSVDRWEWVDGALDAIRLGTDAGWHVFVVTNQSGVARGHYGEADVEQLHRWMAGQVRDAGGTIDDVRFCPFHPDAALADYRRTSDWRKPAPGMILDLIDRWELAPGRCVLVGDQASDVDAARAAGILGVRFDGVDLAATVAPLLRRASPGAAER